MFSRGFQSNNDGAAQLISSSGFPAPECTYAVRLHNGGEIVLRVYGQRQSGRLILSHGNGLAINGYYGFWRHFLRDFQVVVFDFRNHGINITSNTNLDNWNQFIDDYNILLSYISEYFEDKPTFGVFHSLSGLTALLHLARGASFRWDALVLFEPPALPPEGKPLRGEFLRYHEDLVKRTLRRRERFGSVDELAEIFSRSFSFSRLDKSTMDRLAAATLKRDEVAGGYRLACPREFEANTFRIQALDGTWARLNAAGIATRIVSGDLALKDESTILARVGQDLAQTHGFDFVSIPDSTHLLQLERPDLCAAAVNDFLEKSA